MNHNNLKKFGGFEIVRPSGAMYRVALPFYEDPRLFNFKKGDYEVFHHLISVTLFNKLRPVVEAIRKKNLWENPALQKVLNKNPAQLKEFVESYAYLEPSLSGPIIDDEHHCTFTLTRYDYNYAVNSEGLWPIVELLAGVAHVLQTSKEPLKAEREYWKPCLDDLVIVKPGLLDRAMTGLGSLFGSASDSSPAVKAGQPAPHLTDTSITARLSAFPDEDVRDMIEVTEYGLLMDDKFSLPELNEIYQGKHPLKVFETALACLEYSKTARGIAPTVP